MKILSLIIVVVSVLMFGCRSSPQQPHKRLTEGQEKLLSVMNSDNAAAVKQPVSLFSELQQSVKDYSQATADSSFHPDPSFSVRIDSAVLKLSSVLFMQTDPQKIVTALNTMIFETWGIAFDADRNAVATLFPHCVVQNKKGSCVGISLLYLLLAEKLNLPVYGVRAPGHFFCRFDNGTTAINIEPLKMGACKDDAWYRQKFNINNTTIYPLRNCTIGEVVGVVNYNLGTISLNKKRYEQARFYLDRAITYIDTFPEAQGNLALVLDATGKSQQALSLLNNIRKIYPQLDKIDQNIALVQIKCGLFADALASFTQLINQQSDDAQLYYGKAIALYNLHRNEDAVASVRQALALNPDYKEARELLASIEAGK